MSDVIRLLALLQVSLLAGSCGNSGPVALRDGRPTSGAFALSTDKAAYAPGEPVSFTLEGSIPDGARVRYEHLDSVLADVPLSGPTWNWQPPSTDFRGYMAELYTSAEGEDSTLATVGVDVSSSWTRFPRYGFLSRYPAMTAEQIDAVIDNLNRHHINGLQFYDWHHAHHKMIPGTGAPPATWTEISGTEVHLATVSGYIEAAHARNMRAMFYNLVYGALENAAADGVQEEWYSFTDQHHENRDKLSLPPPFVSDIYLLDPGNPGWQSYMQKDAERVYDLLDFDGFHMDQVGERGVRYTYDGSSLDLASRFGGFITAMHDARPDKFAVMNAVNQYGQPGIAQAPSAFLYSEVWQPNEGYADLAKVIRENDALANGTKNSVLTAYVNYGLADRPGMFNTPSVLLADAVIFAFGGAHLELGEHMLGKEYFPNDNLAMKADLRDALVPYYDFLVAYENLLRDGGTFDTPQLTTSSTLPLGAWPPQQGRIAVVGKSIENRQILHLLNFTDATTMSWRDNSGTQAYPQERTGIPLRLATDREVARIWYATPDRDLGASRQLEFTQTDGELSFTLPSLEYWSMVVVEYR
jgi:dextranase